MQALQDAALEAEVAMEGEADEKSNEGIFSNGLEDPSSAGLKKNLQGAFASAAGEDIDEASTVAGDLNSELESVVYLKLFLSKSNSNSSDDKSKKNKIWINC